MARDGTESRFLEVLERFGGAQHVQLVGELWDRAESRALLEGFLRELFPAVGADILQSKAAEQGGRCKGSPGHTGNDSAGENNGRSQEPQPKPERALHFGLVFFVCRPQSLKLRSASRQLREILRDVRERMPAGGAVIGVIMKPVSGENTQEVRRDEEAAAGVPALLAMLHSVFPEKRQARLCCEVRASALIPGQEETRRDLQRLACDALTAADELRRNKPKMKSRCFLWRRTKRWKDHVEKESTQEGTALTALQYPNGGCTERTTDA